MSRFTDTTRPASGSLLRAARRSSARTRSSAAVLVRDIAPAPVRQRRIGDDTHLAKRVDLDLPDRASVRPVVAEVREGVRRTDREDAPWPWPQILPAPTTQFHCHRQPCGCHTSRIALSRSAVGSHRNAAGLRWTQCAPVIPRGDRATVIRCLGHSLPPVTLSISATAHASGRRFIGSG